MTMVPMLSSLFSLVLLPTCALAKCSSLCWEAYSNLSTEVPVSETIVTLNRTVTGVVTLELEFLDNPATWEHLRFRAANTDNQSLVFQVYGGQDEAFKGRVRIFPHFNGEALYTARDILDRVFMERQIHIQISDLQLEELQGYQLYLGTPGEVKEFIYGYREPGIWDMFQDLRMNSTATIKNGNTVAVIRSIIICEDARPKLCDSLPAIEIMSVEIGSRYTLTCSGSGAPYLTANWARTTFGNDSVVEAVNSEDLSYPDHFISSSLVIEELSHEHIGTWTCQIENKNFGEVVEKSYVLMTVQSPDSHWFKTPGAKFVWRVWSWSERFRISLQCSEDVDTVVEEDGMLKKITLQIPPGISQLECTVKAFDRFRYGTTSLSPPITLTRVGYKCGRNEYGVRDKCLPCPAGQISEPGAMACEMTPPPTIPTQASSTAVSELPVVVVVDPPRQLNSYLVGFIILGGILTLATILLIIGRSHHNRPYSSKPPRTVSRPLIEPHVPVNDIQQIQSQIQL